MVSVKVDFVKKDFVWIGLLIVFVGISFAYAYGGNTPNVMGHSAGELDGVCLSDGTNCLGGGGETDTTPIGAKGLFLFVNGVQTISCTYDFMGGYTATASARILADGTVQGKLDTNLAPVSYNWQTLPSVNSAVSLGYSKTVSGTYSPNPSNIQSYTVLIGIAGVQLIHQGGNACYTEWQS